jgi:hypothetical protein
MKASVLDDLDMNSSDVLVIIYSIPSLEQILPIIWTEKQHRPGLLVRAVFVHEGSYTGFGHHHPLIDLATELFDEIYVPFAFGWMQWKTMNQELSKFPRLMRRSSQISRLISRRWSARSLSNLKALLPELGDDHLTIFAHDSLGDLAHFKYVDSLCGKLAVTVGHASTSNVVAHARAHYEQRLNGSYFVEVLARLTPSREITVFYDGMFSTLKLASLAVRPPTIERFDGEWLVFVKSVFHDKMQNLLHENGQIGLLISRPPAGQSYAPDPVRRVQALVEIRRTFEESGLTPVIILHPHEVLNKRELKGWVVVENIHYSLLLDEADYVVTFGTQLAEDLWRKGRKMIEYSSVWQGTYWSPFSQKGKTLTVGSPFELAEVIGKGRQYVKN